MSAHNKKEASTTEQGIHANSEIRTSPSPKRSHTYNVVQSMCTTSHYNKIIEGETYFAQATKVFVEVVRPIIFPCELRPQQESARTYSDPQVALFVACLS